MSRAARKASQGWSSGPARPVHPSGPEYQENGGRQGATPRGWALALHTTSHSIFNPAKWRCGLFTDKKPQVPRSGVICPMDATSLFGIGIGFQCLFHDPVCCSYQRWNSLLRKNETSSMTQTRPDQCEAALPHRPGWGPHIPVASGWEWSWMQGCHACCKDWEGS